MKISPWRKTRDGKNPEIRGAGAAASSQRSIVAPHLGSPTLSQARDTP